MKSYFYIAPLLLFSFLFLWSCKKSSDSVSTTNSGTESNTGTGGSFARFAVVDKNLFTVNSNTLNVYDVSTPTDMLYKGNFNVGFGIETIFPYNNTTLFLGSTGGMYIYDIASPLAPKRLSIYTHVYSCDPVVAEGKYAYVTLHSAQSRCGRSVNRLEIIDISNLNAPVFVKQYEMTNPMGLGIDTKTLFVCDDGLKVYDVTNVNDIKLKYTYAVSAYDVIPINGLLMMIGDNGLYQYLYKDQSITLLSTIGIIP